MTVRDLIKQDIDIDVYDDVDESLGIAFCGPLVLTDEGERHFGEALGLEISLVNDVAIVGVDDDDEKTWKRRLKIAKEFFEAAAGYCDSDDYDAWFNS